MSARQLPVTHMPAQVYAKRTETQICLLRSGVIRSSNLLRTGIGSGICSVIFLGGLA